MRNYYELPVFIEAHILVQKVYTLTKTYPKDELYGLVSQVRRSAVSIPANIVEGLMRNTKKELLVFLYNARGSSGELEYHLLLSKDLGYISDDQYSDLKTHTYSIIKQLNGWIRSEKTKIKK